jgi:hypothetical protein
MAQVTAPADAKAQDNQCSKPLFWGALIAGLLVLYILPSLIGAIRKVEGLGWLIVVNLLPTGFPAREHDGHDHGGEPSDARPTGPGLTCEFDGGRCWVRTNVG